jgi:hypothetical protein
MTLYFEQASIIAAVVCCLIVAGLLKETHRGRHASRRAAAAVAVLDNPFGTRLSPMSQVRSVTHVSGLDI